MEAKAVTPVDELDFFMIRHFARFLKSHEIPFLRAILALLLALDHRIINLV